MGDPILLNVNRIMPILNIFNYYSLRITIFVITLYYNMIVPYLIIN